MGGVYCRAESPYSAGSRPICRVKVWVSMCWHVGCSLSTAGSTVNSSVITLTLYYEHALLENNQMLQFKSYCNFTWDSKSLCGRDNLSNSKANIISHVTLYAFLYIRVIDKEDGK